RQGLKSQLRLQPGLVVVGEVDRADQLAAMVAATPCDILLLDLQMERSALVDIKALAERVTVIVVTASERAEDALAALRSGARAGWRRRSRRPAARGRASTCWSRSPAGPTRRRSWRRSPSWHRGAASA